MWENLRSPKMKDEVIDIDIGKMSESHVMLLNDCSLNEIDKKKLYLKFRRDRLLEAVLKNQQDEIKETIETYPQITNDFQDDLRYHKYKYEKNGKIIFNSILIIACIDDQVTADTLGVLFQKMKSKYISIVYSDEKWFGWEPIHYVASTANLKKMQALLNVIEEVNSLTYFSENALHILLQYQHCAITFGVVLHNNMESKSATIIGIEKNLIVQCADLLIKKGVDVNQTNFWNETPICIAVRYRFTKLIELLLTVDHTDIDSFKESGKTIREYLKWNLYVTISTSYIQEDPLRIRFNYLKSGDENNFLTYNSDSLSDQVNSEDCDSCTMMQFCLRKGFLEYLKDEHYKNEKRLSNYEIKNSPMLNVFKEKGLIRSIIHLLDNGADIFKETKKFKCSLLNYASVRGYYPFVAILLAHKNSKIEIPHIFDALSKIYETKCTLNHRKFYINCVLYLLLNKLIFLVRQNRENSSPPKEENAGDTSTKERNLQEHITAKRQHILNKILYMLNLECEDRQSNDSEIIFQILHLGGSLTYKESTNKMVVDRLDQSLLKAHFDDCINGTIFRYDSIIQDDYKVYNENRTLRFLVSDYNKRSFLTHPLIKELIHEKWSKIYKVFYADLLFYLILLFVVYGYMISKHFGHQIPVLNCVYYILIGIHLIKESIQLVFLYRWKYFFETSNIMEAITLGCCLYTIYETNVYVSVTAILVSTIILFLLLGQLPLFTKYTVIFSSLKYFFQYIGFYCLLFFAFSLCFYLVFPLDRVVTSRINNPELGPTWADIFENLFFILVYFTGEFGDRVLKPSEDPVFGRIMMTVFIFCMTIILNNLLVGLLVADMEDIKKSGRLYKQVKLAKFIQSTNTFIKRLHHYKSSYFIKRVIGYIDVFRKGHEKILEINIHKLEDDCKKYLKEIKKVQVFNRHMLIDVYKEILKK